MILLKKILHGPWLKVLMNTWKVSRKHFCVHGRVLKKILLMFDKSIVEYLPMVPEPPEYLICKKFLDDLLDIMKELDLDHIFAHADELVYSKVMHILWKFPDIYNRVIVLMGGFHQLRVC